ncbi:DNA methyltransferase [Candidatus Marithrix sp. Canyon 246]|uniref:DNA methyltransferase n=1 Tax=Candidatus Marithrix sp. Canyon 246 TaxID=1827136 RepID=UPI00084A172C|nr:DNA methyltransferase [Candidatus Marithrix sp. Canyon 246]
MPLEAHLKNLKTIEDLQNLLIETIGFEETDERVFFPEEKHVLTEEYSQPLKLAELFDFSVLVLPVKRQLLKTRQRAAIETLQKRYPFALYIFVDLSQQLWHWVFPKPDQIAHQKILRRMEIGVDERLHTIIERLTQLSQALLECENTGEVVAAVDKAFDVEMVSEQFFRAYQQQYENFKQRLQVDNKNKSWVYDDNKLSRYVQLLLGRILFLHFLEKKTWLNQNNNFIRDLQLPYAKKEQQGFYREVLRPLFFEALNQPGDKKAINGQEYFIPFLNGGLFEAREEFDEADLINCPHFADELFTELLNMLGQYNFTVDESTPLDQIVGIDPEMLGKVLENLLEAEVRHASGTYYTPRSIVAYMCRETLYRHLSISRNQFNQLVDAASTGDTAPLEPKLAQELNKQLDQLKILDPAVGSGAFLLGMLQEILLLKESLARVEAETIPRATLKRHIIHNSLYAVDISFPAIEIARLRLWLALVVDEAKPEPLPNLDYHIIRGNTLQTLFDGKPVLPVKTENQQKELLATSNQAHTKKLLQNLDDLYVANGAKKSKLRQQIKAQLTAMVEAHWASQLPLS